MNGHTSTNLSNRPMARTTSLDQFASLKFTDAYGFRRNQPGHFLANQFHQDADYVYNGWRDATIDYLMTYRNDQSIVSELHAGLEALAKAASTSTDAHVYNYFEQRDVNCNLMVPGPHGIKACLREMARFVGAYDTETPSQTGGVSTINK